MNEDLTNKDNQSNVNASTSVVNNDVPTSNNTNQEEIVIENTTPVDNSNITSNVDESNTINIVETSTIKGAAGSAIIGSITNEGVVPNNNPLPQSIDLGEEVVHDKKNKIKKIKVKSKKEKIISFFSTIFTIAVLGIAGYCGYYFGYQNNPNLYNVKTINLELGDTLPNTVSFYVTSPLPLDDMEYSVDTSQVANDITGSYSYYVTHKNVTKIGQIIVKDTKAPVVTFKDAKYLIFAKGYKLTKDDLVESCEDISNCEVRMESGLDTTLAGEKEVSVTAVDDKDNKKTYSVKIKVVDIKRTINCVGVSSLSADQAYSTQDVYELNFDGNDELVLTRKYKKNVYFDYGLYYKAKRENKDKEEYQFDSNTFTEKIEEEYKGTINVTSLGDVINYYSNNSYTCN